MKLSMGVALDQKDVAVAVRLWGIGMVICGLIFGLDMASLFDWPRGLLEQVGGNSDRVLQQLEQRVANPVESLLALYRRQERIAALEGQLSRAAVDHNELYQLRGKVALLESQVSRTQPGMKALMVSEIYTKGEVMVLGVGEVDGVVKGLAITDGDGLLVGRVGSVGRYISRIERVGEPGFKIPAQTVGGGAKGVVFSKGNEVIFADVLQTEQLAVGDIVVTSGIDGGLPAGLVIGQVMQVEEDAASVTKTGLLDLLAAHQGWVAIW